MSVKLALKYIAPLSAALILMGCSGYGAVGVGAVGVGAYGGDAHAYDSYNQTYNQAGSASHCPVKRFLSGSGKTRYGYGAAQADCAASGYWAYPVYPVQQYVVETHSVEKQVSSAPLPKAAPVIAPQTCPDGQYKTSSGGCVTVVKQEPAAYVPPRRFPVAPELPAISYRPIRK